jgi:hypothetical protein
MAADWAIAHVPPRSTVVIESLELGLRGQPWHFLFPVGSAGCVDALTVLKGGVDYSKVQSLRQNSPIVDIGNVDPKKLGTCRADFAMLSYFDAYSKERAAFPREFSNYEGLMDGGRTVAIFRPVPGSIGGPTVRIVALAQHGGIEPKKAAGNH